MSQTPPPIPPPVPPVSPEPSSPFAAVPSQTPVDYTADVNVGSGKALAVCSYAFNFVQLPFFAVPLVMQDNNFAIYHARQCLLMWLFAIASSIVCAIIAVVGSFICIGPVIAVILGVCVWLFLLVINIMGVIQAVNGEAKPLPIVGEYAERWFGGIRKKA